MGDIEKEHHFQPQECGNCGEFQVYDEELGWIWNCRCPELLQEEETI